MLFERKGVAIKDSAHPPSGRDHETHRPKCRIAEFPFASVGVTKRRRRFEQLQLITFRKQTKVANAVVMFEDGVNEEARLGYLSDVSPHKDAFGKQVQNIGIQVSTKRVEGEARIFRM